MRSVPRVVISLAAFCLLALVLSFAWVLVLTVIGWATGSGALGVHGPYGPFGGILMVALLVGLFGALVAAFFLARRVLRDTMASQDSTSRRRHP